MRSQLLVILFIAVIFGDELSNTTAIQIVGGNEELISLYDHNDPVVELTEQNITQVVYDPNTIWFVEFYAHWCGHCKRFSPIWKALAREFDGKYNKEETDLIKDAEIYKLSWESQHHEAGSRTNWALRDCLHN